MNKKIAIIGGSGFIGCNLANYFLRKEHEVLVISRTIDPSKFEAGHVKFLEMDANFDSMLLEAIEEYDNIVWLISDLIPSSIVKNFSVDFNNNISPLIKMIEGLSVGKANKRFVYLSSGGTIYKDTGGTITHKEDSPKEPLSPYALSKLVSEEYISFLTLKSKNIQSHIIRPSNIFGLHQNLSKPQGIIGYTFQAILNNKPLDLFDNGSVIRDFLFVDDLSLAIGNCLNSNFAPASCKIYNVGSQIGMSIKEVITLILQVSGGQLSFNNKPSRDFDCKYNVLNIEKINNELGWKPQTKLEEGLSLVWSWLSINKNKSH